MAAIESNPGAESGPAHVGPGLLLRKARESAGVSLQEVAAQLHLDSRTIGSLERDAFDELPAPTFIRGYLRGYARLLNLPVGPVMEAYDREGFHPPDLVADIAEKPQAQSGDLPVRMLTYLIVVVLAALVVWWWYDREGGGTPSFEDESIAGIEPPAPASSAAISGGPVEEAGTGAQPGRDADALPGQATPPSSGAESADPAPILDISARVESELAQVEQSLAASAASDSPPATILSLGDSMPTPAQGVPAAETPVVQEPSRADQDDPSAGTAEKDSAGSQPAPAPAGKASLRIEFPIEAWVEIYDASNEKLFFNLVKPGRILELSGTTPIRVLLGRSKGVTVEFNGEPVDLTPHVRKGGVAQLTLGS